MAMAPRLTDGAAVGDSCAPVGGRSWEMPKPTAMAITPAARAAESGANQPDRWSVERLEVGVGDRLGCKDRGRGAELLVQPGDVGNRALAVGAGRDVASLVRGELGATGEAGVEPIGVAVGAHRFASRSCSPSRRRARNRIVRALDGEVPTFAAISSVR